MPDVLVFVPGLLGSELHDDRGKVWPGSLIGGVFGFDDAHFQRLLAPNLRVGDLVETVGGLVDIYRQWLRAFRTLSRNNKQLFSDSINPPSLYCVPYDWRLALEDSATNRLAPTIRKARSDWGQDVSIHLVAIALGASYPAITCRAGGSRPMRASVRSRASSPSARPITERP